jgi:tight adherence protein B
MSGVAVGIGIMLVAVCMRAAVKAPARDAARRRLVARRRLDLVGALTRRWQARRRTRVLVDQLPTVLDDIARAVRSGSSLRQACTEAADGGGPARADLRGIVGRVERGLPLPTALAAWADASPVTDVRVAAAALALTASAGGPQAQAVDRAAATLRERRAVAGEVHAQSAQARLSAIVIGFLPVAFLLWAAVTDSRTAAFLVASPMGWCCLAAGLALEAAGGLWMRRILREVTP